MFEHLRQSKISESELKQEIIKDLTEQKYKGEWNKKQMKRNVSSQFSNYVEQRRNNNSHAGKNTISSHFSDQSAKKMLEINILTTKLDKIANKEVANLRNLTEVSPLNQQIRGESSNARKARDQQPDLANRNGRRENSFRSS